MFPVNGVRRQNGIGNKFHSVSPVGHVVLLQPDPREPGDFRSGYLTRRVLLFFCYRQHSPTVQSYTRCLSSRVLMCRQKKKKRLY